MHPSSARRASIPSLIVLLAAGCGGQSAESLEAIRAEARALDRATQPLRDLMSILEMGLDATDPAGPTGSPVSEIGAAKALGLVDQWNRISTSFLKLGRPVSTWGIEDRVSARADLDRLREAVTRLRRALAPHREALAASHPDPAWAAAVLGD